MQHLHLRKLISSVVLILSGHLMLTAQDNNRWLDPATPIDGRIKSLLGQLTLPEKISQLGFNSPAITRLNIPAYNWWNEALHGVGRSGPATVFPQAIGLAATFDDSLAFEVASAVSTEARAMYNAAVKLGNFGRYAGLTFWTPNINIFRDPRWGRGQETYGEDPFLTACIGVAFVKGLQGNDPRYLKVAACAKHYAVHSGPEKLRHEFNVNPSVRDLWETYLPAFKALVDAKVEAVMCAYNAVNGEPCCGNTYLLKDVLRKQWNFKGHIVSDCWAISDFYQGHKIVPRNLEAAVMAIKSGVNLECGASYPHLNEAVKQGMIKESLIDSTLAILLRTRFRLGMFDPVDSNPYNKIPEAEINSPQHRELAREVARRSIVLLKNNGVLPLRNNLHNYFITGPNATSVESLLGNYYGVNGNMSTILEGVAAQLHPGSQMQYRPGALLDRMNVDGSTWNSSDAKEADATIVVIGITGLLEGEAGDAIASPSFGDRLDYNLPENQIEFLKKMKEGNNKPVIAVITGGSPMNLAAIHEAADAVLLVWYPGEEGGNAVADILFGKASPSGKLPVTFPRSLDQLPPYTDYSMKGRTYRYMKADPLYPFGFGLSYTQFSYSNLTFSKSTIRPDENSDVEVTVTNTGNVRSGEAVQLYIAQESAGPDAPLLSLKGLKRVTLDPGASVVVKFTLTPEMLKVIDEKGVSAFLSEKIRVTIGGSSPVARSRELGAPIPVSGEIRVLKKR